MHPVIKASIKRAKLAYLWVTRILLAPNRFNVPLFTRVRYAIRGGFIGDQYALYDLKNNNRNQYLSEFDWYRSRWINEPFDAMLNNKIVFNEVVQDRLRVPQIHYIKNHGRVIAHGDVMPAKTAEEVVDALPALASVFMKPLASGKGKGVRRLDVRDGSYSLDHRQVSRAVIEDLLERTDGWFLSQSVEQHADLAVLHSHTTNTIRLITMRMADGESQVFFAVLRIGTSATIPVDNGSRGGLVAKIDLETGELSEARTLWSHDVFTVHPDTGARIQGTRVPEWHDVLREVEKAVDVLPYLQFIAWDILVSPDGPYIIEANTSSGVNIIQLWGPQRNGRLGVFYRQHGIIR